MTSPSAPLPLAKACALFPEARQMRPGRVEPIASIVRGEQVMLGDGTAAEMRIIEVAKAVVEATRNHWGSIVSTPTPTRKSVPGAGSEADTRPAWLDDPNIAPPYPILRCPRCKALFDDHSLHICKDLNETARAASSHDIRQAGEP